MQLSITLLQRPHDFQAIRKDKPENWECGPTESDALRRLSFRSPELANAAILRDMETYEVHRFCPSADTLKY